MIIISTYFFVFFKHSFVSQCQLATVCNM